MPGDLPDLVRVIRLDQSTRVETEPTKPRARNPRTPTYDQVEPRATDGPFLDREQPAVDWLERRGITVRKVTEDNVTRTPDAIIPAERATVEFKSMDEPSRTSMRAQVRGAGTQSRHLVIDGRGIGLDPRDARGWLDVAIRTDGHYLDQVVVILDGPGVPPLEWLRVQ